MLYTNIILTNFTVSKKQQKKSAEYNDQKFKEMAVEFFTNKGFTVWLNQDNHLCFDVDPDSAKWTFEILRN